MKTNMKILGLIPARGGSKGIPQKNLKQLNGAPLIKHSIVQGLKSDLLHTILVSTDSEEIARVSRESGAEVPFMRPEVLAADNSPTIDTVVHALEYYNQMGQFFDAVCLLQPTVPFRAPEEINGAIEKFIQTETDSLISVRQIPHTYNPHWAFLEKEESEYLQIATGETTIIPRRQNLPKAYYRDGSIYITKSHVILEQRSLYGKTIAHYENNIAPNINIDTMEDWLRAEAYCANHEN